MMIVWLSGHPLVQDSLIHHPHLWGETLLSSIVRWLGLFLVIAMQPLVIVFGN